MTTTRTRTMRMRMDNDQALVDLDLSQAVKSTEPADWKYIAEGAANLILAYHPALLETEERLLRGKSLRLTKTTSRSHPEDKEKTQEQIEPARSKQISFFDFHHQILSEIISPDLLLQFDLISLDNQWLQGLATAVEPSRPSTKRDQSSIDTTRTHAIIMDNLAHQSDGSEQQIISVEIKPKWACLPHNLDLLEPSTRETKSKFCRTCVFRAVRSVEAAQDPAASQPLDEYYTSAHRFCALQLFNSRHPAHLRRALDRLCAEWQHLKPPTSTIPPDPTISKNTQSHNNFKIFRHGVLLDPLSVEVDPELIEVLAETLERSQVLRRLAELQRRLDKLDIEGVFKELGSKHKEGEEGAGGSGVLEEPIGLAELTALIPLISETTEPETIQTTLDGLSARTKAVMYALSMTFKDCSIFVRLPVLPSHTNLNPTTSTLLLSPAPEARLPQRTQVKIIDLDLKPISRLHKYFKADRTSFSDFITLLLRSPQSPPVTCLELCNSTASW
ncbi:Inositol-pentakisphosphate 2-kinase [Puccinia graminis f. sp. tritici]|uniref:Inositol-pentakisphosphate 2-kinase n=1 Tax=Puccinia graminis f. sp. tritici TaxID=56615 RepID=A0A5B0MNZ2_PUCGR|nr:Inositol-pentakisphosphate 2-kinase [Puccinia graminis f. sp. tritici]